VADGARKKEKTEGQEGALNVKWKNGKGLFVFMDKEYEDADRIAEVLQRTKSNIEGYRIVIRGDKNLPAIEIQRTMTVLANAGFDNITFSTLNKE
jgi:biopolymer transport protein ExbD